MCMKGNTWNIKNDWEWYSHFKNLKVLCTKANLEWTKNDCVWKTTL